MKAIEGTMSIIHLENNHRKINTLEEIEILKAVYKYKQIIIIIYLRSLDLVGCKECIQI